MAEPFNYLGYYDTYNMHQSIKNMTEEDWLYWTHRQEAFKDYHGSTKCIPILRDDSYSKNERGEETIFYQVHDAVISDGKIINFNVYEQQRAVSE